ncbi:MAG: hypothetical protein M3Z03_17710 [Actinomycetota bacterium]|nr:hypothetical protein [Actinomycetota bacterium]
MSTDVHSMQPGSPSDNTTLVEVLADLAASGYDRDVFVREDDGWVCCSACRACQAPDQLILDGIRRLEGASDPADMAAVLAVTCASCGIHGTAVVKFGPEATEGEAILLRTIDDARPSGLDVAETAGDDASPVRKAEATLAGAGDQVQTVMHRIEGTPALDRVQPFLQSKVEALPEPVRHVLSGEWMGHALHPALTDLPIGFWTSSFVLDLVPTKGARRASTALVGLGVATAVPTAAAGLVDWVKLSPAKRRVGVVHLAANGAATVVYAASFLARMRGRRVKGVALGMLGAALVTAGGALGGHLAFGDEDPEAPPSEGDRWYLGPEHDQA